MTSEENPSALEELFARLEMYEKQQHNFGKHIAQLHDHFLSLSTKKNDKEHEIKLIELPEFEGTKDPEVYLDWARRMDRIFEHKGMDDSNRFNLAILKLVGYASTWYENMQTQRIRDGKDKVSTWAALKSKMYKRFVPKSYKQKLFLKLNSLQQNALTVEQYVTEFEKLYLACGCREEEEQKCAKFLLGLNRSIKFACELHQYETFDDLCSLAATVERQLKESKTQSSTFTQIKSESSGNSFGSSSSTSHNEKRPPIVKSGQIAMKTRVCFRCKGNGHVQADCPSKIMVSLSEHLALLTQLHAEEEEREHLLHVRENFASGGEESYTTLIEPAPDHDVLVLRSMLHVAPTTEEHKEQRENLFHSRCSIKGRSCSLIIDGGSCTNAASKKMVDTLCLEQRDHPRPYMLSWVSNDGGLKVTKQAFVAFEMAPYKSELWCDVVPMDACSLLLGRPWQWDNDAIHLCKPNVYTVAYGGERVGLQPLPPKFATSSQESAQKGAAKVDNVAAHSDFVTYFESKDMNRKGKKQSREDQLLSLQHKAPFDVGDYVWLSLEAQKAFYNSKEKQAAMEEGPFKVVHHDNFDTYQVLLGQGVCVSFNASDLVPCFEPT